MSDRQHSTSSSSKEKAPTRKARGVYWEAGFLTPNAWRLAVAEVFSEARRAENVTQRELAEDLGLTQGAWSRIERGNSGLDLEVFVQACGIIGLDPGAAIARALEIVRLRSRAAKTTSRPAVTKPDPTRKDARDTPKSSPDDPWQELWNTFVR